MPLLYFLFSITFFPPDNWLFPFFSCSLFHALVDNSFQYINVSLKCLTVLISLWGNSSDNLSVYFGLLSVLCLYQLSFGLFVVCFLFIGFPGSFLNRWLFFFKLRYFGSPPPGVFGLFCHHSISICCSMCLCSFSDLPFSKVLVLILLNNILSKKRGNNGMPYEFSHVKMLYSIFMLNW